ncbi:MAG: cytochrome c family protein [Rhizobiales bacterium]|nr:cytochrome c family protein [Hyphomicrobiales bacterium]
MKQAVGIFGFAAALAMGMSLAHAAGDAAEGEQVFKKCKACHVIDSEKNRLGPHLVGIVGRAAGSVDGFKYSTAMAEAGVTWDEATLDQYLADPKGMIPKNRMAFPGLKKEEDRANVIAYLKQAGAGS